MHRGTFSAASPGASGLSVKLLIASMLCDNACCQMQQALPFNQLCVNTLGAPCRICLCHAASVRAMPHLFALAASAEKPWRRPSPALANTTASASRQGWRAKPKGSPTLLAPVVDGICLMVNPCRRNGDFLCEDSVKQPCCSDFT